MGVHIRVVTPIIPTGLTQPSDFHGILSPPDILSYVEIDVGPSSIDSEFDEMLAAPGTVAKIIEAESEGVDAIVIDCMGDPGLRSSRECVRIPVLGPCETTMNLACMMGNRFSVLAPLSSMRVQFEHQARVYGVSSKYASTRSFDIPISNLPHASDQTRDKLLEQAIIAIELDGADTLIIGCTAMIGAAPNLRADLSKNGYHVTVIDPIPASVRIAKALVDCGLTHSQSAFQPPSEKERRGFTFMPSPLSRLKT
jgi:allantoin racemase